MSNYKILFTKFLFILGERKFFIPILIFVSLINSLLDILGISLLVPFFNFTFFPENQFNFFFNFFDKFSKEDLILYFGISIIISFFLKIFFATFLYYFLTYYSLNFQRDLKVRVLKNFLSLNYLKFTQTQASHYFELITNLIPIFSNEVLMPILKILSNSILIIALSLLLYFSNPKAFLFLLIVLIILSTIYIIFSKINKKYGKNASLANESFLKSVKDIIFGYIEIIIFKKFFFFIDRAEKYSKINLNNSMKGLIISFVPKYIIEFMLVSFLVFYVFYLFFFDRSLLNEGLTVIILYSAVSVRLIPSFSVIINSFASINFGLFSIEKIYSNLLNTNINFIPKNSKEIHPDQSAKDFIFESISFADVSFNYNKNKIIEKLSTIIQKNQMIGISGQSGSGKTTFLNLFLGFLEPISGKILINGKLKSFNNNLWLSKISYMPQDIFLLNDSIKINIALKEDLNEKEINILNEAIKKAELKEFLNNQPNGIDSIISDKGLNLSGGQKQRLAIARSIYHNKEIIVLDEFTSALDANTVSKIMELLLKLKKEKTIILSSHDSNVLNVCDKIIKLT